MAQKDGEASVEDILRSIKQVISREDGPRRSADTFARDAARENGQPVPERPASFSPYNFTRPSPFGARPAEPAPPSQPAEDEIADDGRTDVFDLRSLDSDAFEVDEPEEREAEARNSGEPDIDSHWEHGDPVQWAGREQAGEHDHRAPQAPQYEYEEGYDYPEESDVPGVEEPLELVEPAPELSAEAQPRQVSAPATEPDPPPQPAPQRSAGTTEGLIAGAAADALRDRFSALQQAANKPAAPPPAGNPMEDMVRDMLRPMLKQWLDDNMPAMVETIVEREIARITGRL